MKQLSIGIEAAVVLFCLWQADGLLGEWENTPYLNYSLLAFFSWIIPLAIWLPKAIQIYGKPTCTLPLLFLGLLCSAFGMLGSLNALKHIGLLFALAAFLPINLPFFIWAVSALAWLPAAAYFSRSFSILAVTVIRIIMAFIGLAAGLIAINKKGKT